MKKRKPVLEVYQASPIPKVIENILKKKTSSPDTIRVTQNDIDCGHKLDAGDCPIARALFRKFKDPRLSVGTTIMTLHNHVYELPQVATDFVTRYDSYLTVKPFTFTIGRQLD